MSLENFRHTALQTLTGLPSNVHARYGFYGYRRIGPHQRVYLFWSRDDARQWFVTAQAEPRYDYVAVFTSPLPQAPSLEMLGPQWL